MRGQLTEALLADPADELALLALARTYHRDLLRAFLAGDPATHGRGVYHSPRERAPRRVT